MVHFDARSRAKPGQSASPPMSAQRVAAALNAVTASSSPGLSVIGAVAVPRAVSARFDAIGKTYVYRMLAPVVPFGGKPQRPPALADGKAWCLPGPVSVPAMQEAAAALQGRHDFARLRVSGCTARTSERTVFSCSLHAAAEPTFGPEPWAGGAAGQGSLLPWGMPGMGEAADALCLPGERLSVGASGGGAALVAGSVARMARLDRTGAGPDAAGLLARSASRRAAAGTTGQGGWASGGEAVDRWHASCMGIPAELQPGSSSHTTPSEQLEGPWLGRGVEWDSEAWLGSAGCGGSGGSGDRSGSDGAAVSDGCWEGDPLESMLEPRQWLALDLVVSGSAFMYKQVRTMAAVVASAGLVGAGSVTHRPEQGRVSASDVRSLLDPSSGVAFQPSPAPAHGLYLCRVHLPPLDALCRTAAADDVRVGTALLRRQRAGVGPASEAELVWEHQRAAESARRIRRMVWGEGVGRQIVEAAAQEGRPGGPLDGSAMLRAAGGSVPSAPAGACGQDSGSADALAAAALVVNRLRDKVEAASPARAAAPLGMPVQLVLEADGLLQPGQPL